MPRCGASLAGAGGRGSGERALPETEDVPPYTAVYEYSTLCTRHKRQMMVCLSTKCCCSLSFYFFFLFGLSR